MGNRVKTLFNYSRMSMIVAKGHQMRSERNLAVGSKFLSNLVSAHLEKNS